MHTITLPPLRVIRTAIGPNISEWARAHDLPPAAVHGTLYRYAGRSVDMTRLWGAQTRRIICTLVGDVSGAA